MLINSATVMGLELIAKLQQPALWVTHTKNLLYQAVDRAVEFLQLPKDEIGIYGVGKKTIGEKLTVGTVQTLVKGIPEELLNSVGTVILDEAHHCPASSFTEVVSQFPAKYRYGLTATPDRSDGLTKTMFWILGNTIYEIDLETLIANGKVIRPEIKMVETDFYSFYKYSRNYSRIVASLTKDKKRNNLIALILAYEAIAGHFCMVLSERVDHCYALNELFKKKLPPFSSAVLVGKLSEKNRQETVEQIRNKEIKVIFATNQIAEEGLDFPHFDRLFLTCSSRNDRKITQAIGRIMRTCDGKEDAVVFDFVDSRVRILEKQARSRKRMYRKQNMSVSETSASELIRFLKKRREERKQ